MLCTDVRSVFNDVDFYHWWYEWCVFFQKKVILVAHGAPGRSWSRRDGSHCQGPRVCRHVSASRTPDYRTHLGGMRNQRPGFIHVIFRQNYAIFHNFSTKFCAFSYLNIYLWRTVLLVAAGRIALPRTFACADIFQRLGALTTGPVLEACATSARQIFAICARFGESGSVVIGCKHPIC